MTCSKVNFTFTLKITLTFGDLVGNVGNQISNHDPQIFPNYRFIGWKPCAGKPVLTMSKY
jgi:hypothetical protein